MSSSFNPNRKVYQGDPISPYLFVLCIKRLAHYISYVVHAKLWKLVKPKKNGPQISHLLFANNLILFIKASVNQAEIVKTCLNVFCVAFAQRVSKEKTWVFFFRNLNHNYVKEINSHMGLFITHDLGKHLGIPFHHKRIIKAIYTHLVEKVQNRIQSWNSKNLVMARRITLSKSVLVSLPIYSM